jgi:hypothetical protein
MPKMHASIAGFIFSLFLIDGALAQGGSETAFTSALRAARSKCPDTASVPQGKMQAAGKCLYREWRVVWQHYSPFTLDIFDTLGRNGLDVARRFDIGEISRPDTNAVLQEVAAALARQLKTRVAEIDKWKLQVVTKLASNKRYPQQAKERGETGDAELALTATAACIMRASYAAPVSLC